MPEDLFAPPGNPWQRVSPALARVRRVVLSACLGVLAVAAVVLTVVLGLPGWLLVPVLGALLVAELLGWRAIGRQVALWGYAERDEDLYITRGLMWRRLVVVPYGRMQYVDIQAGPLDRAYGIARIELHTASPGTSAHVPGLPAEEAARLRDRLTDLGAAQAAGL
jgi:membrane protein YdbS with pleckstrin-like domain